MASNNPPGAGEVQPREIKVLETAEDIQQRRDEVLSRYAAFKQACSDRKALLEDSRRYQYFKRDADELESWILEKLQTASDESYKDPTNLQVSFQNSCGLKLNKSFCSFVLLTLKNVFIVHDGGIISVLYLKSTFISFD